jgi:methanogenic corrinoid protein MtbC1
LAEVQRVRDELLEALVKGDARLVELVALEAIAEGMPLATLYVDVMTPALHDIGERWQRGELTIADEHIATSLVDDVMALVGRSATVRPRRSRSRVLLGAVENENHVVGLKMLADLAEGAGFDVRFAGAALPVATLEHVVRKHEPRVVGLSASVGAPAWALQDAIEVLTGRCGVPVLIGGGGVPPQLAEHPGVHHAPDAREALAVLEQLAA